MTVLRIKQLVAGAAAWLMLALLVGVVGAAAYSVVVTGSGADPALAFTDPNGSAANRTTTWAAEAQAGQDSPLDDRARRQLLVAWDDETVLRQAESDASWAVGATTLDPVFVSDDGVYVQLLVQVDVARQVADQATITAETIIASFLQQPTGWVLVGHERLPS